MRITRIIMGGLACIILATLVIPPGIAAQDSDETVEAATFSKEELTQMLAPIALYPDSLIAQILMASTYPLELVEAERWLRQNKHLKGDALDDALQDKAWDPSVKSLCHFPDILFAMSEKLDQTRKLGDAFLSQENEVMATIQELRLRAKEQGNLETTKEQKVIVEREIVSIEPSDPDVVYVPVYDPLYVYGPWWYPAYPPYYWYYPPGFVVTGGYISYGPRIFIGVGLFSWAWFDWHAHHIHIDIHKTKRFHKHHFKRDFDRPFWRHDYRHRRGVAYRDRRTSERFGARPPRVRPATPETRGYPARGFQRRELDQPRPPVERRERAVAPGVRPGRERVQPVPRRETPFRGIGEGSFERRAGQRGGESRRSMEIRRPGGEMRRPGGEMRRSGGEMRRSGGEMRQPGRGAPGGGRGGGSRR
ncbi:MAG: DUF3300 domain-containing protein [Nitrospirota bacterium]